MFTYIKKFQIFLLFEFYINFSSNKAICNLHANFIDYAINTYMPVYMKIRGRPRSITV